jgi:tetratricopeptide (TPR) repeat protein
MKPRHTTAAPLPRAPLELSEPLTVRGAGAEGVAILDEIRSPYAVPLLRVLRLVLSRCRAPADRVLRREAVPGWASVLDVPSDDPEAWALVTALVLELIGPARSEQVAVACSALSTWALHQRAETTAQLFAEASALTLPQNPTCALAVGRMLRRGGRTRDAERWFRRTIRVAVWTGDQETQCLALNGLGNLYTQQAAFKPALRYLTRALTLARRSLTKERQAEVTHDLVVLYAMVGEHARAEALASSSFRLYGSEHANIPRLAYDVVYLWLEQGHFGLALSVLRALAPAFQTPRERAMILASTVRAAGACNERGCFADSWRDVWKLVDQGTTGLHDLLPALLLDVGRGAASLGEWDKAERALTRALDCAIELNARDTAAHAEAALSMVRMRLQIDRVRRAQPRPAIELSRAFVDALRTCGGYVGGE